MYQQDIPLGDLVVSSHNTRKNLEDGQVDSGIAELAESIRRQGLLSPLTVRPAPNEKYEVIAGQRRLLACKRIALDPVPCLVRDDLEEADAITISLVENVHRADMSPMDKAQALNALYDQYGSYERVARETSWSASTISKYVQLLNLPQELQSRINSSEGQNSITAMSRLAKNFSGEAAIEAYDKVAGFKGGLQDELQNEAAAIWISWMTFVRRHWRGRLMFDIVPGNLVARLFVTLLKAN